MMLTGASPAASGAEDGAESGDNMDSFIVREEPRPVQREPQVLHLVRSSIDETLTVYVAPSGMDTFIVREEPRPVQCEPQVLHLLCVSPQL